MAQTFEEFREAYVSAHATWASKALPAALEAPSNEKVLQGWTIEKPKHNYFNWHQNRTDKRILELEAKVAWLEEQLKESGALG